MSSAPAMPLPPHNNGGPGILAEYYILLAITLTLVAARTYVALRLTKIYDAAEVFILLATGFCIVGAVFCTIEVSLGLGQHLVYLKDPEYQAHQILKWNTFFQVVNVFTTLFTKFSISFYILRIKKDKTLKIFIGIMLTLMSLATLAVVVGLTVSCIPLRALWDPSVKGVCLPLSTVYVVSYVQSGFTIVVDLALTLSPIIILWNVKIRKGRKTLIVALMSLGLVATVSNALRNAFVPELTSPDFTFASIPITVLAILELNSGIIAACIPAVMPLYTFRRKPSSSQYYNQYGSNLEDRTGRKTGKSTRPTTYNETHIDDVNSEVELRGYAA